MDEVNSQTVDLCTELRVGVDLALETPPVIVIALIGNQRARFCQRYALAPSGDRFLLGKARMAKPVFQIVKVRLGDRDPERSDRVRRRPGRIDR